MATKIVRQDEYHVIEIIGNGHIRETLEIWQVEHAGYEIPDWIEKDRYDDGYQFFVYKDWLYCLSDFVQVEKNAPKWMQEYDGYSNDSFFSGIVVKYADEDFDLGLKVYTYIAGIFDEEEK